jgi:hypothetical protein
MTSPLASRMKSHRRKGPSRSQPTPHSLLPKQPNTSNYVRSIPSLTFTHKARDASVLIADAYCVPTALFARSFGRAPRPSRSNPAPTETNHGDGAVQQDRASSPFTLLPAYPTTASSSPPKPPCLFFLFFSRTLLPSLASLRPRPTGHVEHHLTEEQQKQAENADRFEEGKEHSHSLLDKVRHLSLLCLPWRLPLSRTVFTFIALLHA